MATSFCSITDDTSELLDALGYSGDNRGKDVGANVRLGIPQNIAGRTRLDEGFEDKAMGGIFCSRIELAVREGPRAAQTKLDITRGRGCAPLEKRSIACERRNAGSPRSMSKGLRPALASVSAAKRPAHPAPMTTGRSLGAPETGKGNEGSSSSIARTRERSRSETLPTASRSRWGLVSSTRKLRIKWTSRFCERRLTCGAPRWT